MPTHRWQALDAVRMCPKRERRRPLYLAHRARRTNRRAKRPNGWYPRRHAVPSCERNHVVAPNGPAFCFSLFSLFFSLSLSLFFVQQECRKKGARRTDTDLLHATAQVPAALCVFLCLFFSLPLLFTYEDAQVKADGRFRAGKSKREAMSRSGAQNQKQCAPSFFFFPCTRWHITHPIGALPTHPCLASPSSGFSALYAVCTRRPSASVGGMAAADRSRKKKRAQGSRTWAPMTAVIRSLCRVNTLCGVYALFLASSFFFQRYSLVQPC